MAGACRPERTLARQFARSTHIDLRHTRNDGLVGRFDPDHQTLRLRRRNRSRAVGNRLRFLIDPTQIPQVECSSMNYPTQDCKIPSRLSRGLQQGTCQLIDQLAISAERHQKSRRSSSLLLSARTRWVASRAARACRDGSSSCSRARRLTPGAMASRYRRI